MKRKLFFICVLVAATSFFLSGCFLRNNGMIVKFKDPVFENVVRKAVDKPSGPIYRSDLLAIKTLSYCDPKGPKISDIDGIQYCVNMTALDLSGNNISDISPIQSLKNLRILDLSGNEISDISPVRNLTNLKRLSIFLNPITDLSPLKGLGELRTIYASTSQINDIKPLNIHETPFPFFGF